MNPHKNPDEFRRLLDRVGHGSVELVDGALPAMAGGATVQDPVAQPLGGATVNGTQITIDDYVNPPTRIPSIVRDLVAANRGYFAERIFATPGMTVEGGAVIYDETFPEDYFLPADQSIAPRAPGSEAPRLGATRHDIKVARPESWSGSIEVTDEARRRNQVISVKRQFTQAANTFANKIQARAIETLVAFVASSGRTVTGINWRAALTNGVPNADPATLPQQTFALVNKQFQTDEVGQSADLLIIHPNDAFYLDVIYGDKLQALLDRYGLTMLVSPRVTEGDPIFVREGGVGDMLFEKPLDQEYTREGTRKTDVFTLEVQPVFVAHDASAIIVASGVDD